MKPASTGYLSITCEVDSIPPMVRSFLNIRLMYQILQPPAGPAKSKKSPREVQDSNIHWVAENFQFCQTPFQETWQSSSSHESEGNTSFTIPGDEITPGSASRIDVMHQPGLCVPYDCLKVFITDIANSVICHCESVEVVVPTQADKSVVNTGGFDNIHHNSSSTTATSAIYGTCISICNTSLQTANTLRISLTS